MPPTSSRAERLAKQSPAKHCPSLLRLLHAADCFPRGGLYTGYYAVAAATRYEHYWLEISNMSFSTPPLDVAFAWFAHRQDPAAYRRDLLARSSSLANPDVQQAFSFGPQHNDYLSWTAVTLGSQAAWPPPAPGSPLARQDLPLVLVKPVTATMGRFSRMLRSWLRPHFLDEDFLARAQGRYARFLELHAAHPEVPLLVPTADIALVWHTHLGVSGDYAVVCGEMFGAEAALWGPDYLHVNDPDTLTVAYGETKRLYERTFGEVYDSPDTAWLADSVPYPLMTAANPLAFALRVYDNNPQYAQQEAAIRFACSLADMPVPPPPGQAVSRGGGHALYAAWLAAKRSEVVYNEATCDRCCPMLSKRSDDVKAVMEGIAFLVSIEYFLNLPDTHTHRYLSAITLRRGLWKPSAQGAAAHGTFSPTDPEKYLWGYGACMLKGMARLLTDGAAAATAPSPPLPPAAASTSSEASYPAVWGTVVASPGPAPATPAPALLPTNKVVPEAPDDWATAWLWVLLRHEGFVAKAQQLLADAEQLASQQRDVGLMQSVYQRRKRLYESCQVYGTSCDYYAVSTLYLTDIRSQPPLSDVYYV